MVNYNWSPMPDIKASYITDPDFAQNVVNFLLSRHSTMRRVLESITVIVTEDNFDDVLSVTIGDVITIQDSWTGHNAEYAVLGEMHSYDIRHNVWRIGWTLRLKDLTNYFTIDESVIDGDSILGY